MSIKAVNRHRGKEGKNKTGEQFAVNYEDNVLYDLAWLSSRRSGVTEEWKQRPL